MKQNIVAGWATLMLSAQGPSISVDAFANILQKCRNERDHKQAQRLSAFMFRRGLEVRRTLCNSLALMFLQLGTCHDAQQVFDRLLCQDDCASDATESHLLDSHTLVTLVKIGTKLKDIERSLALHVEILRLGLLAKDVTVGNMLLNMYAKLGSLDKMQEVFNTIPVRDVVSWNVLISGYAQHDYSDEAFLCYEQMQIENIAPDARTYIACLRACSCIQAMDKGCMIHSEIERRGMFNESTTLGTALVAMYIHCGSLEKANETSDQMLKRDVVMWTTLITGYSDISQFERALVCFETMQSEGIHPDDVLFMCSLKACGSLGDINRGLEIHADIERKGILEDNVDVGNSLVDMYCKCGLFITGECVFKRLPVQNVVGWNTLVTGYANNGHGEEALSCFERMLSVGVCATTATYVSCLKACAITLNVMKGQEIHLQIKGNELIGKDLVVGTALVDMYTKCGLLDEAQQVINDLPSRNVFLWNALIAGYANCEHYAKALTCLCKLQLDDVIPNVATYIWSLKACGCLGAIEKGEEIHAEIRERGNLESDIGIGTALVDMYVKCCCLLKAQKTFDKISVRNVVSWTALIAGYAGQGHDMEALHCFEQMLLEGVSPNMVTFLCSLKACICTGATDKGKEILDDIARKGLHEKDLYIGNALVAMFSKCGSLDEAQDIFDQLPIHDVVSWNALMAGSAEHGHGEDALKFFEHMQLEGVSPDNVTFLCSLKACGNIGAVAKSEELHIEIERKGLLHRDALVGSALVDMYAKFGLPARAQEVLEKLPVRNVVSWNALIAGFSQLGESRNVFLFYDRMLNDGLIPDPTTFVIVLSACNHTGMFDKCETYFDIMSKDYGIVPILEHHGCMVDMLGRTGQVEQAEIIIKHMPVTPNTVVWHTLLGACKTWGNVELGRKAFESAVCLDEKDGAAYALMSGIYAGVDGEAYGNAS